jgi:hypothetical protein
MLIFAAPWIAWLGWRSRGYKRIPLAGPLGPPWMPTEEVFLDPVSVKPIRVWINANSGDRSYVEDNAASGAE